MNDRGDGGQHVLLDLMSEGEQWFGWPARAIEQAADRFRLVINAVIYSEVSGRYTAYRGAGCCTAKDDV